MVGTPGSSGGVPLLDSHRGGHQWMDNTEFHPGNRSRGEEVRGSASHHWQFDVWGTGHGGLEDLHDVSAHGASFHHHHHPALEGRKRRTAETAAMECGISSALRGFGDIFGTWADDHVLHRHAGACKDHQPVGGVFAIGQSFLLQLCDLGMVGTSHGHASYDQLGEMVLLPQSLLIRGGRSADLRRPGGSGILWPWHSNGPHGVDGLDVFHLLLLLSIDFGLYLDLLFPGAVRFRLFVALLRE
mmetsp:Transcript_15695/g.34566  ORF Transcript_15695/g.34566 Transcript_15695/m.34566 type:complete len:243 (-) Transcript_15695:298-1026(-)